MWHPGANTRRRGKTAACASARLARDEAGNLAVEFGLLAPVLLAFVLGIMEGGRLLWAVNALHYSVEEAARCASINKVACGTANQIASFAAGRAGAGFDSSLFTATVSACGNRVSASYSMPLNFPFVTHSISLSAQSCYPI